MNGDADTLRQLLSAGVPVLIETWHEPKPNDGMGHYRLLIGYDDAAQEWIAYDSYDCTRAWSEGQPYAGIRLPYAEMTRHLDRLQPHLSAGLRRGAGAAVEASPGG